MRTVIEKVWAREILNAKGKPTIEAEVVCSNGIRGTASAPSGASTGKYEALELYDGGARYRGFGTRKAVKNVNTIIGPEIEGMEVMNQRLIDKMLLELDGTPQKSRLGSNAILAVSMAAAKAGAQAAGLPLYRYLGGVGAVKLPNIASTVISGGEFSPSGLEFEDYLLLLEGFTSFTESVEALCATRYLLEKKCRAKYGVVAEDGGALAPPMANTHEAFETIINAAREAGCEKQLRLGLDVAANGLYIPEQGCYQMTDGSMTPQALSEYYERLCKGYPLIYIEDPFNEDDWEHFAGLTAALPHIQIVGDDLFATNADRLQLGIERKAANTLLMKVNQIGTVTEALKTASLARENRFEITASLRSGETTDDFQADMAVAVGARQMKLGSPVRGERNVKYNRLMRIEDDLLACRL